MCDGKHSSKRDVVILSIKPKRPDYPTSQKVVPITELLQEWDKLDAYYRGQLLKLTKSFSKRKSNKKRSRISSSGGDTLITSSPHKVSSKHSSHKSSPVIKKNPSLSSDQFTVTELFGDENLFANNDGNNNSRHNKNNKLLHSRSLNSLFEDSFDDFVAPTPPANSRSRKNSLSDNTNNLVVSIPVLSVQQNFDDNQTNYKSKHNKCTCNIKKEQTYLSDEEDKDAEPEVKNFLSVPRDNFQVQYGTRQKTRVALLETGGVSPRWIVPVNISPYKPPTAQGLNGVQIQKILYHKNDSVNFASPTTTTARTPDKPPDNVHNPSPSINKSAKASTNNSPVSMVSPSPRNTPSATRLTSPVCDNNNATPKQSAAQTPELSSPKSDQGSVKSVSVSSSGKLSSPPVNSTTGSTTLKRPGSLDSQSTYGYAKKQRISPETASTPTGFANMPVTSSSSSQQATSLSDVTKDNRGLYSRVNGKESNCNGNRKLPNTPEKNVSPKKLNIINKNPPCLKQGTGTEKDNQSGAAVFISPAAISITDRIIKKASMPQPELVERQRRRALESNQRKSYAMQKGDEHQEKEAIELSMKSFEMIWNIPLLSPLRSP